MSNERPDYDVVRKADSRLARWSDRQVDDLLCLLAGPHMDLIAELLIDDPRGTKNLLWIATQPAVRKEVVRLKKILVDYQMAVASIGINATDKLEQLANDPTINETSRQELTQVVAAKRAVKTLRDILRSFDEKDQVEFIRILLH